MRRFVSVATLGSAFVLLAVLPASASTTVSLVDERGAFALWDDFADFEGDSTEFFGVSTFGGMYGDYEFRFAYLGYQVGTYDGTQWNFDENLFGYTLSPTITMSGHEVTGLTAEFTMIRCFDFDCGTWEVLPETSTVSITWSRAPGIGYEGVGGFHFGDWTGSGCTVDAVSGLVQYRKASASGTWTWQGVTRTFPTGSTEFENSEFEFARNAQVQVCTP